MKSFRDQFGKCIKNIKKVHIRDLAIPLGISLTKIIKQMFKDDCKAVLNFVEMSILLKLVYKFGMVYDMKKLETIYKYLAIEEEHMLT